MAHKKHHKESKHEAHEHEMEGGKKANKSKMHHEHESMGMKKKMAHKKHK